MLSQITFSQSTKEINVAYDQFLELEFEDPKSAHKQLMHGLEMSKEIKDAELTGIGFKYLSWYYEDMEDNNTSLQYVDSCIFYTEKTGDKIELVNAYNQKGNLLSNLALLDSSLIWYQKALQIASENDDNLGIAKVANNIALVYTDQGEYLSAIDYYHLSIEKSELIDDIQSVGDAYNNLGSLFTQIEDYEQALEYHNKAYIIRQDSDDPLKLSSVLLNMGRVHLTQGNYESARSHFFQSLAIDLRLDDLGGVALNYNNIGLTHFREKELDSAIFYYEASLKIRKELNDPFGLALTYNNIGEYYIEMGQTGKAISNCRESYDISSRLNLPYEQLASCECLYKAYEQSNDLGRAYKFLKESVELEEKLNSEEKNKQLTKKEMEFVFHYKELEDSLKQAELLAEKEYQIKSAQIEKDQLSAQKRSQLWLFSVIGCSLVVIGGIIYWQLRRQRKQNQIIKEKNAFIQHQKEEIDQSIAYAQKIQDTALPSKILDNLFDDTLLIYLPRDIVSGDFYWLENTDKHAYFAVADCTGHGIPGAFISMMGTILLNEIYNSKQIHKPGEVLDELNRLVQLTLMSRTGKQMKDGMDIAFCRFDRENLILEYAGANNPCWIISKSMELLVNGEKMLPDLQEQANLFEIKADKKPVGKYIGEQRSFNTNIIQLSKGDQVYLFSDGYADQFGGERGKKFKYKPFKELLIETSLLSGEKQNEAVIKAFNDWKRDYEQIDDVCILGVKV